MNYTGLSFTEGFESFRREAYWDDIGKVWTIGYGATGPHITEGTVWTQQQAQDDLQNRMSNIASVVTGLVTVALTQDEFNSLCDFAYNCGIGALRYSTLLKDVNAGHLDRVSADFEAWDHASGKVVAGLLRRRIAEAQAFKRQQAAGD